LPATLWGHSADLQAIRTRAERGESGYRINGTKTWITNGVHGTCFAVLVKTDPDATPAHRRARFPGFPGRCNFNSKERLREIRCPSLIIHAALDQVTSPRTTRTIEDNIPGAQGLLWTDVAHVIAGKQ
jgi:alkylation response protein AidB-like acyl-CoA dehydrogenase